MVCKTFQELVSKGIVIDNFAGLYNAKYSHFFLTHAHSDHMRNLSKSFEKEANCKIYCSSVTKELVKICFENIDDSMFVTIEAGQRPFGNAASLCLCISF